MTSPEIRPARDPRAAVWQRIGIDFHTFTPGGNFFYSRGGRIAHGWVLDVPCWLLVIGSLVLPAARVVSPWCRHRLRIAGMCPNCGYDLRGTPDRCPECGTAAAMAR